VSVLGWTVAGVLAYLAIAFPVASWVGRVMAERAEPTWDEDHANRTCNALVD